VSRGTETESQDLEPQHLGLLDSLPASSRARLEASLQSVDVDAGAVIFRAGDAGDAMYLIRSGLVDVRASDGTRLVTMGPGETVGELSLVTGRPRSAGAVAQTEVTLLRLEHADFITLLGSDPHLAAAVARVVSERLRSETGRTRRRRTIVVWGPDRHRAASAATLLAGTCGALLGEEPVVLAGGTHDGWGSSAPPHARFLEPGELAGETVRLVREHSAVLVVCDGDLPVALLGADHVVSVDAPAPPGATGKTHRLGAEASSADVAALARTVCNRRIGLALGSGGIRGFAHAGVLAALTDEGIPIDLVAGTSAGAVAGALWLRGMQPADLTDLGRAMRETVTGNLPSFHVSPRALVAGRRMLAYLRERLGPHTLIEDLDKPFAVAVTDLDTHEPRHLDAGPLADAVAASAAVPGVFPAVSIGGHRYVDGGASDPVPVGALRERGADIVVAVNVMAMGKGPLGLGTRRRFRMPEILETLLGGFDTLMRQIAVHSCASADLVVEPAAPDSSDDDPSPSRRYMHAGERAMQQALPRLRELIGPQR
jgi:NTE family protein